MHRYRSHWYVLAFAAACALAPPPWLSARAWPFGVIEGIWMLVALHRGGSLTKCSQVGEYANLLWISVRHFQELESM
jgi:hypothetical protein